MIEKTCEQCEKPFLAHRKNARFCGRICKDRFRLSKLDNDRNWALASYDGNCQSCASICEKPIYQNKKLICGKCKSQYAHQKFRERVPNPGKGYSKKLYKLRKVLEDS